MEKFKPSKINTEKVVISIRIDINTLEEGLQEGKGRGAPW